MAKAKETTEEKVEETKAATPEKDVAKKNKEVTTEPVAEESPKAEKNTTAKKKEEKVEEPVDKEAEKAPKSEKKSVVKETPKSTEPRKMAEPNAEDFDWDNAQSRGFGEEYTTKEKDEMASVYTETLTTITEKELVEGIVVGISNRDVILNIGFKSDGLVSASEFRDTPDLKVGDTVEVYIEEQENAGGQIGRAHV